MSKEIERVFQIDIESIKKICADHQAQDVKLCRIDQNYLLPHNSHVSYNDRLMQWEITLIHKDQTKSFVIKQDEQANEKISDALSGIHGNKSLSALNDCAIRIRLMDGGFIFTFKRHINSISVHEFESPIDSLDITFKDGQKFTNLDKYVTRKNRYKIKTNHIDSNGDSIVLDLDIFDDIKLGCRLEAEFPTETEAYEFDFNQYNVIKELTGKKGTSNKDIAIAAGTHSRD